MHLPVLLEETIDLLALKPDGVYVDGTLGGGGHTERIASQLKGGRLIGIDQDEEALRAAKTRLEKFSNITYVHSNFSEVKMVLDDCGIEAIDGALLDLGVSSYQLDEADRGFSYRYDAPLDMRMNQSNSFSAFDVVNTYPKEKLAQIIWEYGEERYARKIADRIVRQRESRPIDTTFELVDLIKTALGGYAADKHPAKRTFQAIRIEVNHELGILDGAISDFFDRLKPGGRLAVITFHSLEDRLVKNSFRILTQACTCPPSFPVCVCGGVARGKLVNRKPVTAGDEELAQNPRAKSAKLRVIEKL